MRSPIPLAATVALVAAGAPSELSAQTATRSSTTTTVARVGPGPLSTTEKLTMLGGVAGASDAAALAEHRLEGVMP